MFLYFPRLSGTFFFPGKAAGNIAFALWVAGIGCILIAVVAVTVVAGLGAVLAALAVVPVHYILVLEAAAAAAVAAVLQTRRLSMTCTITLQSQAIILS